MPPSRTSAGRPEPGSATLTSASVFAMESKRSELLRASPRMFDNNVLDRVSRVHHVVPLVIFLPAIGVLLYLGFDRLPTGTALLLALAGYVFWSLSEYWIHRAIF